MHSQSSTHYFPLEVCFAVAIKWRGRDAFFHTREANCVLICVLQITPSRGSGL